LAATNTCKQSAETFELFVLWLHNQCYYTCDAIGIKMTYRDLPYYKGIRAKTRHEYKLHENKPKITQTFYNELLLKLWKIGITGNLWWWFRSYLNTRQKCVHLNGSNSTLLPVLLGTPQGWFKLYSPSSTIRHTSREYLAPLPLLI